MSYYNAYPPAPGGYSYPPPPMPAPTPVATYPGLPPTGPTPYGSSYPQSYEACPSTGPYPAPPPQSAAYQPYPTPSVPPYSNPANHPVPVPTAGGKRKAFLIGINYIGNPNAHLDGCINDTNYLKFMLINKFKFDPANMLVQTDDQRDPMLQPTRVNIINGMRWLVSDAAPGDSLFFSFSGHGGQVPDYNGDEIDGLDETIMPVDYKISGPIVDDDIHAILGMGVPPGAKLTAVMDCCHSGTGMDLPFSYSTGCQSCDPLGTSKITRGDIVCFSGCRDDQTSADSTTLSYVAHSGVLTYSFVKAVEDHHPYLTYSTLLQTMQTAVRQKGFRQVIQMTSGKQLNMDMPFTL